jgi:hypothetical protein
MRWFRRKPQDPDPYPFDDLAHLMEIKKTSRPRDWKFMALLIAIAIGGVALGMFRHWMRHR